MVVFYVREHPKVQSAVALVLNVLETGPQPTDWCSKELNSGLLGIRLVTYPLHHTGS